MKNQIIYAAIIAGVATSILYSCHRITGDTDDVYVGNHQKNTPLSQHKDFMDFKEEVSTPYTTVKKNDSIGHPKENEKPIKDTIN